MSIKITGAIALILLANSACTSLQTIPDSFQTDMRSQALHGFPYALPMRQYDLVVSWSLNDCVNRKPSEDEKKNGKYPKTTISAKVTSVTLLSPGERYLVDYRALSSAFKTSDFAAETYPSGTLKSLNATAEDKTGDVALNVVKTGLSLASLASSVPPIGFDVPKQFSLIRGSVLDASTGNQDLVTGCSDKALELLDIASGKADNLRKATKDLNDQSAKVEELAILGAYNVAKRAELLEALQKLRNLSNKVTVAKKALTTAQKPLTQRRALRWPEDVSTNVSPGHLIEMETDHKSAFLELFSPVFPNNNTDQGSCKIPRPNLTISDGETTEETLAAITSAQAALDTGVAACVSKELPVFASLERAIKLAKECSSNPDLFLCRKPVSTGKPASLGQEYTQEERREYEENLALYRLTFPVNARDGLPDKGIFVRPPAKGRLVVCHKTKECEPGTKAALLVDDWVAIPQLGQLRFLPFENKVFENNVLVVALAEDGSLSKFQYTTKSAAVEQLTGAVASIGETLVAGRKSIREERATQRTDKLAELDYLIGVRDKQADLAPAEASTAEAAEEEADTAQMIALKLELEIQDAVIEQSASSN